MKQLTLEQKEDLRKWIVRARIYFVFSLILLIILGTLSYLYSNETFLPSLIFASMGVIIGLAFPFWMTLKKCPNCGRNMGIHNPPRFLNITKKMS